MSLSELFSVQERIEARTVDIDDLLLMKFLPTVFKLRNLMRSCTFKVSEYVTVEQSKYILKVESLVDELQERKDLILGAEVEHLCILHCVGMF